jgi:glycosyltransferase involved in cell wall biosynthesis
VAADADGTVTGLRSPAVTVVIPSYNYAGFVDRAVRSVLEQTVPPREVIVVDDGSSDDTLDVLRQFGAAVRVERQENRGVASTRNRGAALATSELLAFLDADDEWLPEKLERQLAAFEEEPDVGLVHCAVRVVDVDGQLLTVHDDGRAGWLAEDLLLHKPAVVMPASTGIVPTAVFRSVGGFDERLSTAADWELCLRIALRCRVAFVPDPLVSYRVHPEGMHFNLAAQEHDVVLGLKKAFAAHPELRRLRRASLSSLFTILAGSYLAQGDKARALRYGAKSIIMTPSRAPSLIGRAVLRPARRTPTGPHRQ